MEKVVKKENKNGVGKRSFARHCEGRQPEAIYFKN
jgi:hypothetical protein